MSKNAKARAREMAKREYGRIVSLASVAGFMCAIDLAPYGVAKSGIIGLTRSMALELADYGITGCEEFGHTPVSVEEEIPWKCQRRGARP